MVWDGIKEKDTRCPKCKCHGPRIHNLPEDGRIRVQEWHNNVIEEYEGGYFNDGRWVTIKNPLPDNWKMEIEKAMADVRCAMIMLRSEDRDIRKELEMVNMRLLLLIGD